ncbi:DUF2634 domain-containing protein [Listeria monocytogenes]|uniref:DUF2634 domain-containing protein n=1 Tax=Listeria monocytogenes TaxID=1639 RepID=UPI000F2A6F2B|nr:DUF2634 domain-containing protein [Listeria monocytogenes]EAC8001230.1 DUF2634 domain-containing protein [Listeria monocytogenes]EJC6460080.1 DUF2634 domain-containing protein [Listeria monocytogenes]EJT8453798.1 DUF2634 domain-containing protein [Listeria monocytogenes]MCM64437.1 DUF2634 domain-containing protein [Listeria monocytogenes]TYU82163.1 DUF2634 domain-containing protein [Listeria monocytogenes]
MNDELVDVPLPSKTYKLVNGRVVGFIDDLDAVRQAVEKILRTERFEWIIYTESYGIELSDLIGEQIELVKAEVERLITESILIDDRVLSIEDFTISGEEKNTLWVSFNVVTMFGMLNFKKEVVT